VRLLATVAAFLGLIAAFDAATTVGLEVPEGQSALASLTPSVVGKQLSEFDYYRKTIGFSQYLGILPSLVPHALLLAALIAATIAGLLARKERMDGLWIAWATLALGGAVAAFHASAFAYFWMTLGLFPAVALAVSADSLRRALPDGRERTAALVTAGLWLLLVSQGAVRAAEMSIDTQGVQRESLAFVHRNFESTDAGFHPEHGPFCRREDETLGLYFSQVLYRHFAGPHRETYARNFLGHFRERPVKFLLESFRLNQFPVEIRRFFAENYQPYRASVFVAGRRLEGDRGQPIPFELIAAGRYRWLPFQEPQIVRIGDQVLEPGQVAHFDAGQHAAEFSVEAGMGMLVLALDDPPSLAPLSFYKSY
jgi:hypothetical protein